MILIIHTSTATRGISAQLGRPEYSYRFVLAEFRPLLDELGIVIEVGDPQHEVDPIYHGCVRHGEPCVFLCFMPPNKVPIGLACPTIPVFAWEYETLPNEAFGGKPRNDWTRVLTRLGAALTHSSFTVDRTRAALGPDFPVASVPAPLWDRMQPLREPMRHPVVLPIAGLVIDSRRTDLSVYRKRLLLAALPDILPLPENAHEYQGSITLQGVLYTAIFNPHDSRKNWLEMISAFCDGLREKADATLLLKLTHHDPTDLIPEMLEIVYKMGPMACRVLLVHSYLQKDDYDTLLRATTYALNTSLGEGQCLPLMEYMSAGKPAVAPRHTAMLDYVNPDNAFIIDSSDEPGTWPHDQRQAFRTLRQRIHYQSLVKAYRRSYHVARHEPGVYAAMSAAATDSLRRYCSIETVQPILRRFIFDQLDAHAATASDDSHVDHA
ncbi:MAG: glycosyltransferase family 1 protein [Rhodanobacter sp.]|nr:MAG: glycosyltransferase family 1 protein [Rhodanobacter sp.]TAL91775.1 MAG: glycosyltransferase family 1 protein [Rhodanobacter sp.]TAM39039.1 MAG: glycosyltransferase family 1 protein [Rhodanobacter sp.]